MTDWLTKCGMGVSNPPAGCYDGESEQRSLNPPDPVATRRSPSGRLAVLCQHGPNECKGNLVEGCVKSTLKEMVADYWPFIACYEGQDIDRVDPNSPLIAMEACFNQVGLSKETRDAVVSCVNTPAAAQKVLSRNAALTAALVPAHGGTPWILIDGDSFDGVSAFAHDEP